MNTHDDLVGARNLVALEGWWNGEGDGNVHGYCVTLATYHISSGCPDRDGAALHEVALAAGFDLSDRDDRLIHLRRWNDAKGRTKAEVLALFDKAIAATAPSPFTGVVIETEVMA